MKKILASIVLVLSPTFTIADKVYDEGAANLCENLKQKTYSKKCYAQIKKKSFNDQALAYCEALGSWNKIKNCLTLVENKQFEEQPFNICKTSKYYNNDFKGCLNEIAGKSYVSNIELKLCSQEKTFKKKAICLKTAESKPFEAKKVVVKASSSEKELAELRAAIKKAYGLLRENKTTDATIALHEIVNKFPKEETETEKVTKKESK